RHPLLREARGDGAAGLAHLPRRGRRPAAIQMSYEALYDTFRWCVPADFNIAEACCGRWARGTPDAVAIRWEHESGQTAFMTYAELQREANRLSHVLARLGVARGDRVAIVLPQRFEA